MSLLKGLLFDPPILKGLLYGSLAVFLMYRTITLAMLFRLQSTAVAGGGTMVLKSPVFLLVSAVVFMGCLYLAS